MQADLIIYNIGTLITPKTKTLPVRGKKMSDVKIIKHAFIAIKDGKIKDFGGYDYQNLVGPNTIMHNAEGNLVLPGLVDSHTHLVYGGSREDEFIDKIEGVPYLDILKRGGGILSTVEKTRKASFDELYDKAFNSLNEMLLLGVTTVEAKSGYGLNEETELKQLEVAKKLNKNHPIDIVSTYLGAHAVPKEFKKNTRGYVDEVIRIMEIVKEKELADFVDVFLEDSVFNKEETARILINAERLEFKLKLHADEIVPLGGATLAAKLNAASADHLMAIDEEGILSLSKVNTVANLLPSTSFYLNKDFAPARKMIENNVSISISSDYNPGSSPSENFQFSMQLAANKLKMYPNEIVTASTINAAYNLRKSDLIGSIEVGKNADIVIFNSKNLNYLLYHFGVNHTKDVFKNGVIVVKDRKLVEEK
ncbi:imidazolonepropionase [Candidatus Izimaplasma bacterium ZiA1]|uniref:imidazolonepropionase n=1 Tax=Candidatus Izimoplasma sp. ZiA1 TaxID=2024899 RepID=UPI000BAA70FE|nr:imidazolonepropionase [Candidatus Izimaplasma bacterium ZiA1]